MPEITPFAGIRYDHNKFNGDLSNLIAPPYDVLDERDKRGLLAGSERNIVSIDLPHIPPKSAGPTEVYERSARMLNEWLADGTLIRETAPALYLYHQRFEHGGRTYTRRMFIARVRLVPFTEGSVLPHERTFGGPKEDRLALMKATKCQLSAILGMYTDPQDKIGAAFADAASKTPDVTARLEDVDNKMWIVTDRNVVDEVVATMKDKRVYIADGHHRYGTALMYRDFVRETAGGELANDHPAGFIMFVLASMDDAGCLILPYHRALADIDLQTVLDAWSEGTAPTSRDEADIVLWEGRTGKEAPLRFTRRDKLAELGPHECEAWSKLDYAYLHRYLIDELLRAKLGGDVTGKLRYVKSEDQATRLARDESGVALLVNATPMAHLRALSESGGLMPQKSTYFHPKLATGLTINPLT